MLDGPTRGVAVAVGEPLHDGVLPLRRAVREEQAGQNRRDDDGEDQRAEKREGHRPGHRLEESAFDSLQGKDGQVGRDDNADGIEDRPLHFVCSLANLFGWRETSLCAGG